MDDAASIDRNAATTLAAKRKAMEKEYKPPERSAALDHLYLLENAMTGGLGTAFEAIDNISTIQSGLNF